MPRPDACNQDFDGAVVMQRTKKDDSLERLPEFRQIIQEKQSQDNQK